MSEEKEYEGGCFCSAVRFKVKGPAMVSQICHCSICRRLQGSSLGLAISFFGADKFEVTEGKEELSEHLSPQKYSRMFCRKCGTRVFLSFEKCEREIPMVALYPTLLDSVAHSSIPEELAPSRHIYYADRLYDFHDGKPKFADMPAEFGGSGKQLDDKGNPVT